MWFVESQIPGCIRGLVNTDKTFIYFLYSFTSGKKVKRNEYIDHAIFKDISK